MMHLPNLPPYPQYPTALPTAPRILIVDDEPHVRKFLRIGLQAENFNVLEAATAEEAIFLTHSAEPHAMILDLGLPDLDGCQVIRDIRQKSDMPILVLSGRTEDSEKIAALEQGADDYITKPFSIHDLVARVRAALEQKNFRLRQKDGCVTTGDLHIHLDCRAVERGTDSITLDDEEYRVLKELALHGGRVLTYGSLARAIWEGEATNVHTARHDLQKRINTLRYKIENEPSFPRYIVSEATIGYRLEMHPPEKRH